MAYIQDLREDRRREEIAAIAVCVWLAYAPPAVHDCWYKREIELRARDNSLLRKEELARACANIGVEARVVVACIDCVGGYPVDDPFAIDPNNEPGDGE